MTGKINLDDEQTINHYHSLLIEHGETYRALDWGSQGSQERRFEVLADIGIRAGDRILDVGCGLADFNAWLLKYRPGVVYSGIDIAPNMVARAKSRFPNVVISNGTISNEDFPRGGFDYVLASGIFFLRRDRPKEYMESAISQMYHAASKGIAFNSLSAWANKKTEEEFHAAPSDVVEFCASLSRKVVLRHDYHPGDFTVYVYRSP